MINVIYAPMFSALDFGTLAAALNQSLIARIVLFTVAGLILFIYLGYPILMFAVSRLAPRPVSRAEIRPRVSLIIAAHNEERDIAARLENALALDYPKELLQIIVASDCSDDRTDEIVQGFSERGVILQRQRTREGKTRAQHRAISASTGEILVFSDATTKYESDTLRKLVRSFADPFVGCVAGRLVYVDGESSAVGKSCRSYWSYEHLLKSWESRAGSLIGVSGCLYAVRRSCYAKLAGDMIDDFVIAAEVQLQGLRTVYEPQAVCSEETNHRARDEFRMRVRVIEQTMNALCRYIELLDAGRHGAFLFQIVCHKALRYAIPALLILAFTANWLALEAGQFYQYAFFAQCLFYYAAFIGWLGDRAGVRLGPLSIPYYFVLINVAVVIAFMKFLNGEAHVVWEPSRNSPRVEPISVSRQVER